VLLRFIRLLCRVDELHAGGIVGLFLKRRRIDGHEHFDRRIANKLKNVTGDRASIWLAEHSMHMDYGYAIKNRNVSDERHDLDLLRDCDAAIHLLRDVQPSERCAADRTDGGEVRVRNFVCNSKSR
jgi:hypothetical protein